MNFVAFVRAVRDNNDDGCDRRITSLGKARYKVHYDEFNGGHDYLCWRGSLADGLLKLTDNTL